MHFFLGIFLSLFLQTDSLGVGGVKFIEYFDSYKCDVGSSCHFYFYNLIIFDKKGEVLKIGVTSSNTDQKLVNLQQVHELKGYFTFDLKTNTTVNMSLEVWDKDGAGVLNPNDRIRTVSDLVIPFHEITTNTGWKNKIFNISSKPYAYLDIQFILARCQANFRGLGCNFCAENYYTSTCDKYYIAEEGKKATNKLIIGVAIGTILLAVILAVVVVLMRKKGKKSDARELLEASDLNDAKSEKANETGKGAQSSTITSTPLEMTYATLNHYSSVRKSKENEGHFEHATYDTLNREHSIEDNCEQSNYNHLIKPTHQTHLKKGQENINQGVRRTEDLREEETYANVYTVAKRCGPSVEKFEDNIEQLERNNKADTTYSSLNHDLNPAAVDEEDSYSVLTSL